MTHNLTLKEITNCDNILFKNLMQFYEAEFSYITKKIPDEDGLFLFDTEISDVNRAFIAYSKLQPIGFSVVHVALDSNLREILEFYILPCYRREYYGKAFSSLIFDTFKGYWIVKQLVLTQKKLIVFGVKQLIIIPFQSLKKIAMRMSIGGRSLGRDF